jgi:hypothetical protein
MYIYTGDDHAQATSSYQEAVRLLERQLLSISSSYAIDERHR